MGLQPVPQWFWARLGPDAPWQYNAQARPGLPMPGDPCSIRRDLFIRENDSPIDEIAVIAHVRQSLSQKDWDGFVETYGLPPLFLELPPDIPAEREAEYQAQAEAIIGDARGTVPNGTQIHTVDSGARGQNPFAEHLQYQDELIVLAATGGKLTALAESGSGTLAGGAHQRAFDDITEAEAALISEIFQQQFDASALGETFSGPAAARLLRAGGDAGAGSGGRDRPGADAGEGRLRDRSGGAFREDGLPAEAAELCAGAVAEAAGAGGETHGRTGMKYVMILIL